MIETTPCPPVSEFWAVFQCPLCGVTQQYLPEIDPPSCYRMRCNGLGERIRPGGVKRRRCRGRDDQAELVGFRHAGSDKIVAPEELDWAAALGLKAGMRAEACWPAFEELYKREAARAKAAKAGGAK